MLTAAQSQLPYVENTVHAALLTHPLPIYPSPCYHSEIKKSKPNFDPSNTLLLPAVNPFDNPHGRGRSKSPQANHLYRPYESHPDFSPSLPPNNRPCFHPSKRKKTHDDHSDTAEERKEDARPVNAEVGDQRDEAADEVAGCEGDATYEGGGGGRGFEVVVVEEEVGCFVAEW